MDCLFCQIIQKQIPSELVYEDDNLIVFPDISPSADLHLLIVPKKHLTGMGDLGVNQQILLGQIYEVVQKLVKENNLENSLYRVLVNGGKAQHIPHVHFHLLGGNLKKMV